MLKYLAIKVSISIRRDNIKIKDIQINERPRERLIRYGVQSLNNEELLSCILKDGTKNMNVKEMANMILSLKKDITELRYIRYEELLKIKGIGISKACSILSAIELGNRINSKGSLEGVIFKDTNEVYEYFKNKIGFNKQEVFHTIYLDAKNMILKDVELFKGTLNQSIVHPREIFKEAYNLDAVSIICIHNHPSGNILPSKEDLNLTKRLKEIGDMMGVKVLDHLIIGSKKYYSFYENGDI